MTLEVTPSLKPDPAPCVCGCGAIGRPRVRAWNDGLGPHNRNCVCRRCRARNYGRKASARERGIAKQLGGERQALSGALSGADVTGRVDLEETSNLAVTRGLRRWWESKGVATKRARLEARTSDAPKALVLSWGEPCKPQIVVMRWDDFRRMVNDEP